MEINEQEKLINSAIELATKWQTPAVDLVSDFDRDFFEKMKTMLKHPTDKVLLIKLMDQCFRPESNERIADQLNYLFEKYGLAHFFSRKDGLLLWMFQNIGKEIPSVSVPIFID